VESISVVLEVNEYRFPCIEDFGVEFGDVIVSWNADA
jgi:hypothetical protein